MGVWLYLRHRIDFQWKKESSEALPSLCRIRWRKRGCYIAPSPHSARAREEEDRVFLVLYPALLQRPRATIGLFASSGFLKRSRVGRKKQEWETGTFIRRGESKIPHSNILGTELRRMILPLLLRPPTPPPKLEGLPRLLPSSPDAKTLWGRGRGGEGEKRETFPREGIGRPRPSMGFAQCRST